MSDITIAGGKFKLLKKCGRGAFGEIYSGLEVKSKRAVAIKLEPVAVKVPQLKQEHRIYQLLAGGAGIPEVRWFGPDGDYNTMVMELLGPSLQALFDDCGRKFSVKTTLLLAD